MHYLVEPLFKWLPFCQLRYNKELFEFKGSNDHTAHEFREVIFVGATDVFDQAMNTESFQTTGDLAGRKVVQVMSEIFASQPIDDILSADDDFTRPHFSAIWPAGSGKSVISYALCENRCLKYSDFLKLMSTFLGSKKGLCTFREVKL